MTNIGESISIPSVDGPWECPFEHDGQKHEKHNILPPPNTKNDAAKLAKNMGEEQYFHVSIDGKEHRAKLAAHHVLPGNESWPHSDLHKWVNKANKNYVTSDIGYDVNAAANGVNLCDDEYYPGGSLKKQDYAYAFMKSKNRQFHDRHTAYSEWVINRLNKIAIRLDREVAGRSGKGCGKENCPLDGKDKEPYEPPYNLLGRLYETAKTIKKLLLGSPKQWRMPVMTSRFAVMYQLAISEEEARQQMSAARATLKKMRTG
ncbi:AHH domain-containing protein [Chondromyces apiculatus]|uniref:Uncharacterized protein n=1 Tax=Chondromyces apiculatus DSM 436 TaxID=1192034 RepID=A0A017T0X0_9BACT|nr:AHH domain-containing protein [Chondromyces apiculatus]EYF02873.1 Hypothetical protein CAP_6453 [Chondromyces apiculatus DSM 436]